MLWDAIAAVAATMSAMVAARIAKEDGRNADQRADDDRAADADRTATQREHDGGRYRLDHLLFIAEAFEATRALRVLPHQPNWMQTGEVERRRAEGILRARLAALCRVRLAAANPDGDLERPPRRSAG